MRPHQHGVQFYTHCHMRQKHSSHGELPAAVCFISIFTRLVFQNGFWFSILCSLVLFIPTIILSVKLGNLYQKLEPYPGPLVEA